MPIERDDSNDNFTFAVFSDTHIFDKAPENTDIDVYKQYQTSRMYWDTNERFIAAAKRVNDLKPDFVIITGDMIDHVTDQNIRLYNQMSRILSAEIFPVIGNHDNASLSIRRTSEIEIEPQWDLVEPDARATFWSGIFPGDKFNYSFDRNGFRFIIINNADNKSILEQLPWLESELRSGGDSKTFIFSHVPLKTSATMETIRRVWAGNESLVIGTSDPQFELLHTYRGKIACIFSGHLHTFSDDKIEGLRQVVCPMTAQSPDSFLLCKCNSDYTWQYN
ncbi:metallophosphoesterase [bacterium]|nr:metallophosphoesterase [bacterium]